MHNKILSLFNYNIESDFSKNVLEKDSEVNFQGAFIRNFTKKFEDKCYYLFETISVKDFGQYSNIILSSKKFSIWKLYWLKKLINDLYAIYGKDPLKGRYSIQDFRDIKELDFCLIRDWPGIEKQLLPCDIEFDRNANLLQLTIFGTSIDKKIKEAW